MHWRFFSWPRWRQLAGATCWRRSLSPALAGHTNGIPVLLDVAHGVAYSNDPEVT